MEEQKEQWMSLILQLKDTSEKKGITQGQIAEKTGLIQSNVSRFFSLKYKPTLETFTKIAESVGVDIQIQEKEI